jgi:hypothetical protein
VTTGSVGSWLVGAWEAAVGPAAPAVGQHLVMQVTSLSHLVGAGDGPSWDSVTPFLNVGITGVVLLMVLFRKGIVPEWSLRDAERRITQLEARNGDLEDRLRDSTNLMMTQVMPVTTRAVDVTADLLDHLEGERGRRGDRGEREDRRDDTRGRGPRAR